MNKFLIKHPVISEKSTDLSSLGKYVFVVDNSATAPEVKKAIEGIYKVNVVRVNVVNTKPKPKNFGRFPNIRSGYRKAIVTLKEGQKLDILPK
jgi:large subunit ribosomal protein L23